MFFQFVKRNLSSARWEDNSFIDIVGNTTIEEIFKRFYSATTLGLMPIVSILGVLGNLLSMRILSKHGLHKCSNILIFALALADTAYLVGINNIPLIIFEADLVHYGFFYSEPVSRVMYVLLQIFVCLETIGKVVSLLLPTLIIFERFIAVFWPFHFSRILTARRVQLAAVAMYPLGVPPYLYYIPLAEFHYVRDTETNVSFGMIVRPPTFNADVDAFNMVSDIYTTVCGPVSVGFVVVGCVMVGLKVHLQMAHRRRMMMTRTAERPCSYLISSGCFNFCLKVRTDDYGISTVDERLSFPESGRKSTYSRQVICLINYTTPYEKPHKTMTSSDPERELMTSFNCNQEMMTPSEFRINQLTQELSKIKSPEEKLSCEESTKQPDGRLKTGCRDTNKGMRTTKILLSVCVVYSVTVGLSFLSDMVFNMREMGYFKGLLFHRSGILAMCVNSGTNFIIYVVLNRNFRETYKQMFCGWVLPKQR